MRTTEITGADRTFPVTSGYAGLPADLTESERLRSLALTSETGPVERIVSFPSRGETVRFRFLDYGEPRPYWFGPVLQAFADLLTLPRNWDGEGAAEIDRPAINRALSAIEEFIPPHGPSPSVVPVPDSGLQIEWHRNQKDLEIEFSPSGEIEFYYFDEATGEESQGRADANFENLHEYVRQIW